MFTKGEEQNTILGINLIKNCQLKVLKNVKLNSQKRIVRKFENA